MQKLFLVLLLFNSLSMGFVLGQTISSGYVYDSKNNEPIIGALVFDSIENSWTYTNEYGYFSLTSNEKKHLQISFLGYIPIDTILAESQSEQIVIKLRPIMLSEVTVTANQKVRNRNLGAILLPIKNLNRIPTIGGEKDILKSISILPGISLGQEGSSNLFVRGGTPDQNLILLDGIPVYNTTHLGGNLSVFNSDAINSVKLTKGGFPARYGGRLSSIIDIQMNNGNTSTFTSKIGLGLLNSTATISAPIKKQKSSFMVAGRTAYLTLLKGLINNKQDDDYFYSMADLNVKTHFLLRKGAIFLSFYKGSDRTRHSMTYSDDIVKSHKVNWGNNTASIRYVTSLSDRLFGKVIVGITKYNYGSSEKKKNVKTDKLIFAYANSSSILDYVLKLNFDLNLNQSHQLNFGSGLNLRDFSLNSSSTDVVSKTYSTPEYYVYAEDTYQRGIITSNIGLRWSGYSNATHFSGLEPRFSSTVKVSDNFNIHAGISIMQQYIHLLPNNGFGLPNDIWVPVTTEIKPQKSLQLSIGSEFRLEPNWPITIDFYKKTMTNQIAFKKALVNPFAQIGNWENLVEKDGIGKVYGADFLLKKQHGKLNILSGYTISWNYRQFDNLNKGERYFFTYDKRHDFSINFAYFLKEKLTITANWVFTSGRAITLPIASTPLQNIFNKINDFRLPPYHRLDVGLEWSRYTRNNNKWIWDFSIYNIYNRINPNFINVNSKSVLTDGQFGYSLKELQITSLFPFFPGLSVKYEYSK